MKNFLEDYVKSITLKFPHLETSEMGYRTDFEILLKGIFGTIGMDRIGHDTRAEKGNKPDFIVYNKEIPILYIETKNIGTPLDKIENSNQMTRYFGYANLVLTDYLEFRLYRNGIRYCDPIKIANYDVKDRSIEPLENNYDYLAQTLLDFSQSHKEPIRSGTHLSKIMGGKAQRIRDNIRLFLANEIDNNTDLVRLYKTLKKLLVHDLTIETFSDMYAQTLVYGLFVARYHDKSLGNFSRQEARELIPNSNPLLRHFFDHIVGADFDKRLKYIVDELCEVFSHADVAKLMEEYFKNGHGLVDQEGPDPVIHFYEDFLKEYDPELRKRMGAYYTPQPVVQFIIKSVDEVLKTGYSLADGIADTAKNDNSTHRVQILDPASGTGTFISAIIDNIYARFKKSGQEGRWPTYVHRELLPRLHGFELMMAPYTIAHLKLGIAFRKTGFWDFHRRLGIYLTNSLEESTKQTDMFAFGLAESIADESKEASVIKNKTPIMVVVGNPPYSGESSNKQYKGHDVYKKEPEGGKLQERNSKWLNDDYVKFIRLAESMIEKTGEGVLAMITAHGYIDNPTFRGMRYHLMKTFDQLYVLDLHGNANKKERAPDGSEDQNVFNIKTGVAILIGVKKHSQSKELAEVFHADLYGKRAYKFQFLNKHILSTVKWAKISPSKPNYEWVARDDSLYNEYSKGFSINELFPVSSVGIVTSRDDFVIDMDREVLSKRIQDFLNISLQDAKAKYKLRDTLKWKIEIAHNHQYNDAYIAKINYRPFDTRYIYYHDDLIERSRKSVMAHLLHEGNIGIVTARSNKNPTADHFFITNCITEAKLGESSTQSAVFPLFLHDQNNQFTPNLNEDIFRKIESTIGETLPRQLSDYIYAILYSNSYRQKYNRFLKGDFPRITYPNNTATYQKLADLGLKLQKLHLMDFSNEAEYITTYSVQGTDTIEQVPSYTNGNVYVNKSQYFGNVPEIVWDFYIGGYQPAQKWLKDRKGRKLNNEDIEHYQKIIVAINETIKIMKQIDQIVDQ
ncbi:MAG: hypothetical protein ACD_22C00083G0002 [uncultured bacterium]|nr:MAG: hypothetical protein ACD_22C00083G0002 [uncultured bacterium]